MRNILDIGCGQGFDTYLLTQNRNNNVVGIDFSQKDILIAKKRYPSVDFILMNAEKLIFKVNSFDEVRAIDVLEHVDNLHKVLKEISRVLKKGGTLIASIPYYKSEKWLIKIRPTYFKEIHHVRTFKKNELEKYCKELNLILHKKTRVGFLRHIELYFLFKRKHNSKSQVSIGNWRENFLTKTMHGIILFFDTEVLNTPLKFVPIWAITIPIGEAVNLIGNIFFPKSLYYEFIKK